MADDKMKSYRMAADCSMNFTVHARNEEEAMEQARLVTEELYHFDDIGSIEELLDYEGEKALNTKEIDMRVYVSREGAIQNEGYEGYVDEEDEVEAE